MKRLLPLLCVGLFLSCSEKKEEAKPIVKKDITLMRTMWFDGCMSGSMSAVVGMTGERPENINVMFLGEVCSSIAKKVFKNSHDKI